MCVVAGLDMTVLYCVQCVLQWALCAAHICNFYVCSLPCLRLSWDLLLLLDQQVIMGGSEESPPNLISSKIFIIIDPFHEKNLKLDTLHVLAETKKVTFLF